jgi:DNA-binding NtrC family response regulator
MAHGAKAIMLLIGKDEALLRTQALIFESAEYVVVQAGGKDQALKLLKSWSFGIVVIDSTLPREERNLLVAAVRSQTPDTRVVVFHASADAENVDLVMDSREGAASVLAKVNALFPKPPRTAPGTDATVSKAERKPN